MIIPAYFLVSWHIWWSSILWLAICWTLTAIRKPAFGSFGQLVIIVATLATIIMGVASYNNYYDLIYTVLVAVELHSYIIVVIKNRDELKYALKHQW